MRLGAAHVAPPPWPLRFASWLSSDIALDLWNAFRWLFVAKLFLFELAHAVAGPFDAAWFVLQGMLLVATAAGLSTRWQRLGLAGWLAFLLWHVRATFPSTPNHHFLETLFVLVMVACPTQATSPGRVTGHAARFIQCVIVLVFALAGIQKLGQGHWYNGEYLCHSLMFAPDWNALACVLRALVSVMTLLGLAAMPAPHSAFAATSDVTLPTWVFVTMLSLSWVVILAECALPVMMLSRRLRPFAFVGLLALQIGISATAGIWGFGITGVACLLLWSERAFRGKYLVLFGALVVLTVLGGAYNLSGASFPFVWL